MWTDGGMKIGSFVYDRERPWVTRARLVGSLAVDWYRYSDHSQRVREARRDWLHD